MLGKKLLKFGKSFKDVDTIKKNFFSDNNFLLKKQNKLNKFYISQPLRKKCKACNNNLKGKFFTNHNIKYVVCKKCSHVNGFYQDTNNFAKRIYVDEKVSYSQGYFEKNINQFKVRQKKIYDPKAKFLKDSFKNVRNLKILDVGAGSGYFVSSLIDKKFKKVRGLEVSKNQVIFGKKIFSLIGKNENLLKNVSFDEIKNEIRDTDFNCISLIGVLEHVVDMSEIMKVINKNKNIKYLYILVPMFSFICIVENIFGNNFNRHLGGGHTHLFTEKSLKKFMKRFGFVEQSSWWFGTDMHDFYRSLIIEMRKRNFAPLENEANNIKNEIDSLQLVLDKKKICSEVHMLLKRK